MNLNKLTLEEILKLNDDDFDSIKISDLKAYYELNIATNLDLIFQKIKEDIDSKIIYNNPIDFYIKNGVISMTSLIKYAHIQPNKAEKIIDELKKQNLIKDRDKYISYTYYLLTKDKQQLQDIFNKFI